MNNIKWVRIEKLDELIGIPKQAVYAYRKSGVWREGKHLLKRRNRLYANIEEIQKWIEGKAV